MPPGFLPMQEMSRNAVEMRKMGFDSQPGLSLSSNPQRSQKKTGAHFSLLFMHTSEISGDYSANWNYKTKCQDNKWGIESLPFVRGRPFLT